MQILDTSQEYEKSHLQQEIMERLKDLYNHKRLKDITIEIGFQLLK